MYIYIYICTHITISICTARARGSRPNDVGHRLDGHLAQRFFFLTAIIIIAMIIVTIIILLFNML